MRKTREGLEQIIQSNKQYEIEALSKSDCITQEVLDREEPKYQRKRSYPAKKN